MSIFLLHSVLFSPSRDEGLVLASCVLILSESEGRGGAGLERWRMMVRVSGGEEV